MRRLRWHPPPPRQRVDLRGPRAAPGAGDAPLLRDRSLVDAAPDARSTSSCWWTSAPRSSPAPAPAPRASAWWSRTPHAPASAAPLLDLRDRPLLTAGLGCRNWSGPGVSRDPLPTPSRDPARPASRRRGDGAGHSPRGRGGRRARPSPPSPRRSPDPWRRPRGHDVSIGSSAWSILARHERASSLRCRDDCHDLARRRGSALGHVRRHRRVRDHLQLGVRRSRRQRSRHRPQRGSHAVSLHVLHAWAGRELWRAPSLPRWRLSLRRRWHGRSNTWPP